MIIAVWTAAGLGILAACCFVSWCAGYDKAKRQAVERRGRSW